METSNNPYASPIADPNFDPRSFLPDSNPQGFPKPLILAAMGLILGLVSVTTISYAVFAGTGGPKFFLVAISPPIQLAWVVYTLSQTRRYQESWSPGTRGMVHTTWILNVLLLGVEFIFIFYLAAAFIVTP